MGAIVGLVTGSRIAQNVSLANDQCKIQNTIHNSNLYVDGENKLAILLAVDHLESFLNIITFKAHILEPCKSNDAGDPLLFIRYIWKTCYCHLCIASW